MQRVNSLGEATDREFPAYWALVITDNSRPCPFPRELLNGTIHSLSGGAYAECCADTDCLVCWNERGPRDRGLPA